ncbi:MAG: hypothetical protein WC006_08190 [Bacilli bacterium]
MFKVASKETNQNFYLLIRNDGNWIIYKLEKGKEEIMSENQFKTYFITLV